MGGIRREARSLDEPSPIPDAGLPGRGHRVAERACRWRRRRGGRQRWSQHEQCRPRLQQAVSAIKAQNFEQAIPLLVRYVARAPDDANGENWLAYAYRKSGLMEPAFEHYAKALKIDPNHLGAHEYVGEAYLMVGNLAKAEEHLKILDKLCFLPCEEYTDLKTAVAAYRANQGLSMAKP
jgi:tetratricopeptide (TPR) repeat protein